MSPTFFIVVFKNRLLLVLSCLVLAGCSLGGGSADLDPLTTKMTLIRPKPPKPSQDEVVEVPKSNDDIAKYGFAFKNPTARYLENKGSKNRFENFIENIQLVFGRGKEAKELIMNLRPEDIYALNESSSLDEIILRHPTYWKENEKTTVKFVEKKVTGLTPKKDWIQHGDLLVNEDTNIGLLNFEHTQMGFIGYPHTKFSTESELSHATLFYRGINRSNSLPASLNVSYAGHWAYMLPMSYYEAIEGNGNGYYGQNLSFSKGNTSFVTKINANLGDKTLTGKLSSKDKKSGDEKLYFEMKAELQGNQFTGKAVSKQSDNAALNKNSDALHGNFYGEGGKELAGAFYALADKNKPSGDKALAVVFIAKKDRQDEMDDEVFLTTGSRLLWKDVSGKADVADLGYVDNVQQLSILDDDGKRVVLALNSKKEQSINNSTYSVDACCDNFQFLRLGDVTHQNKKSNGTTSGLQESLFVQGVLTPPSDVPISGQAHYVGKWQMRTLVNSTLPDSGSDFPHEVKGDAVYHVNFGDKKLSGSLVMDGGLTAQGNVRPRSSKPWVNIEADIKGNQFSGTAEMPETKTPDVTYKSINIKYNKVEGGLFGPDAAELGGHIVSDDGKSGVVFGGKKQKSE